MELPDIAIPNAEPLPPVAPPGRMRSQRIIPAWTALNLSRQHADRAIKALAESAFRWQNPEGYRYLVDRLEQVAHFDPLITSREKK